MLDARGIDTADLGWINREFQRLRRELEAVRSERRASATTITDGDIVLANGGRLVVDGGDVTMLDDDGSVIFRIGVMALGDRGLAISRENGNLAFEVRQLADADYVGQSVAIYDNDGRRVIATDDLTGGLRTPYFEHPFQPVSATPGTPVTCGPYGLERTTSSATWETAFAYDGKRQNPFLDLKVAGRASDGTTSGEVRIVDLTTGDPLPDFFNPDAWVGTIPAGSTSYAVIDPIATQALIGEAAAPLQYVRLGIQVRRTAGSGSITLAVPQSIGG